MKFIRKKTSLPILFFFVGCILAASSIVSGQSHRHSIAPQIELLPSQRLPKVARRKCRVPQPQVVAIESLNYPGRFLRHHGYSAVLNKAERSDLFVKDSSFVMRPGLAGEGVSFESVNFPGFYLRHRGYSLVLNKDDGRGQFAADATFRMTSGLAGVGVSLEPVNLPGHYVRHFGHRFRVSKFDGKQQFVEDATFQLR